MVDFDEFVAGTLRAQHMRARGAVYAAFLSLDANGDGRVSHLELEAALGAGAAEALAAADADGDGVVSYEEFAAAVAPEGEQDAQQQGGWRKALAALGGSVMNAAVGACMYDAVGKVRLAATRLLLAVSPHLPPEEVLKVALVKAREI